MGEQRYIDKDFKRETQLLIDRMNAIVVEYVDAGYRLTVRQLYYQLVARDIVENTERSYKRVTGIVNDAKLAGLMDWDAIEDRTREFIRLQRWHSPSQILEAAANSYHMDLWIDQPTRVFVIVEKEALAGVLEGVCKEFDAPLLAARGYPSGTVLREFALSDVVPALNEMQTGVILHLGDHDPSGIDMTRDLEERISLFAWEDFQPNRRNKKTPDLQIHRIALTMQQIDDEKPPPNPAKTIDPRFASYEREYGTESWELDALRPQYLDALVRAHISALLDKKKWKARRAVVEEMRNMIKDAAARFEDEQS